MKFLPAIAFTLALAASAHAQSGNPTKQSGHITPGHMTMWVTNGVIGDGGTAAQGNLSSVGVTASGPAICQNSAVTTVAYNQICLGVTSTSATLSVTNVGGATGGLTLNVPSLTITGFNGCLQASTAGVITSTGSPCGSGGGGNVTSVTNNDGTLTISPTTGAVVASLNLGNANTWTATQTFGTVNFTGTIEISGTTVTLATLAANQTFSGTDTFSGTLNVTGTFKIGGATVSLPISVANGGTGASTFTANLPLIGNGASAIAQGTVSGNTTVFGTTNGALVNGDCVSIDANGNLQLSGTGLVALANLPGSDPGKAGQLYTTAGAVMVSGAVIL